MRVGRPGARLREADGEVIKVVDGVPLHLHVRRALWYLLGRESERVAQPRKEVLAAAIERGGVGVVDIAQQVVHLLLHLSVAILEQ